MADTKMVAIINVTPDSFSDGGQFLDPDRAIAAIRQAIRDGADVIDIGAESTRPGAMPIDHAEEWQRLFPLLTRLPEYRSSFVKISIDTRHAETAKAALEFGVDWINDVSGFADLRMVQAVKNSDCSLVVMHSLGVPADKSMVLAEDADVVKQLLRFGYERLAELEMAGIKRNRLIFDPGIGFGKTPAQSQEIINRIEEFAVLGVPLFIGHSRKSFLAHAGDSLEARDAATLDVSRVLATKGVDYLRVHNIRAHRQMLREFRDVA